MPLKSIKNAIMWGYTGTVFKIVSQLLTQIVLLRAIGPHAYGAYAAAFFAMTLTMIAAEMGLTAAVIHAPVMDKKTQASILGLSLISALTMGLVMFLSAPFVAIFFNDADIADLVRYLSLVPLLQAPGNIAIGLLRKNLDIKGVQISQLAGYVVGFSIVGIALALTEWGAMSLVAAWIVQSIVTTMISMKKAKLGLTLALPSNGIREHAHYGLKVFATNIANWVVENLGVFMIGRIFGAYSLGLYSATYQFVKNPTNHLINTIQTIALPVAKSRIDDIEWIKRFVMLLILVISCISSFVFVTVAVLANPTVAIIFGAKWNGAESVLAPLAIAMIFHSIMAAIGPVLWGRNKVGSEFKVQLVIAILMAITLLCLAKTNIVYATWAISAVLALRCIGILFAVSKEMSISAKEVFCSIKGAITISVIVMATSPIAFYLFTSPALQLIIAPVVSLFAIVAAFMIMPTLFIYKGMLPENLAIPRWLPTIIAKKINL